MKIQMKIFELLALISELKASKTLTGDRNLENSNLSEQIIILIKNDEISRIQSFQSFCVNFGIFLGFSEQITIKEISPFIKHFYNNYLLTFDEFTQLGRNSLSDYRINEAKNSIRIFNQYFSRLDEVNDELFVIELVDFRNDMEEFALNLEKLINIRKEIMMKEKPDGSVSSSNEDEFETIKNKYDELIDLFAQFELQLNNFKSIANNLKNFVFGINQFLKKIKKRKFNAIKWRYYKRKFDKKFQIY